MNRFERLRYERGLSMRDVQRGSGVSMPTLARLEGDKNAKPTAPVARALADFYKITIGQLLGLEEFAGVDEANGAAA